MASLPYRPVALKAVLHAADRRLAGAGVTVLVHVALILGWQMARTPPPAQLDEPRTAIQWLRLPAPAPRIAAAPPVPMQPARPLPVQARRARPDPAAIIVPAPTAATAPATQEAGQAPAAETPAGPSAQSILENARRSAGGIDRALRKESKPTIVAPLDSPQIRMRQGMEQAHALAPPRLWEAPKVEELVNNTGDGARRTRVITGNGTYCITERSPVTSIDMIEKHGRQTFTSCPKHETPATKQAWRTARD